MWTVRSRESRFQPFGVHEILGVLPYRNPRAAGVLSGFPGPAGLLHVGGGTLDPVGVLAEGEAGADGAGPAPGAFMGV